MKTKKKLSSVDKVGFSSGPLWAQKFLIIFLRIMREINTSSCFYRFFKKFFLLFWKADLTELSSKMDLL